MTPTEAEMVARIEAVLAAYSGGELDGAAEMFHPDAEIVRPGGQGLIRGRTDIREWMNPEAFSEQTAEPLDFVLEGDKMVSRTRIRSRGAGSGIEFETVGWASWTFTDDGLISRLEVVLEEGSDPF